MANNLDKAFADYYYVKVQARAVIDGKNANITSLQLTFPLDDIPFAEIDLALGRNANTDESASDVGMITAIQPFVPVQIYMTLTPAEGRAAPKDKPVGFPKGEFMVFTGFVAGLGTSKRTAGATVSLQVKVYGYAVALAGSSQLITGMIEPSAATTGAKPIQCKFGNEGAARAVMLDALKVAAPKALGDLWGLGIKALMRQMVNLPMAWAGENPATGAGGAVSNTFAGIELDRIASSISETPSKLFPALPLSIAPYKVDPDALLSAVHRTMVNVIYMNWAGYNSQTNLWTALKALQTHFFFHFVPGVTADCIAPITFGLSGDPLVAIDPSEYSLIDSTLSIGERFYSYLSRVALMPGEGSVQSSPWQVEDMVAKPLGFAAATMPNGAQGRFHLAVSPAWILPPGTPGKISLNFDDGYPDAANPGKETPEQQSQRYEAEDAMKAQTKLEDEFMDSGLGNNIARTIMMDNMFENRNMTIAGRIRFDIAPGSLVSVRTAGEKFLGDSDLLFGHALSVRIEVGEVSGGESYARTVLELGHVRSQSEHTNGSLTTPLHPLYQNRWVGGKLVEI